jgi:hypothetical protein
MVESGGGWRRMESKYMVAYFLTTGFPINTKTKIFEIRK